MLNKLFVFVLNKNAMAQYPTTLDLTCSNVINIICSNRTKTLREQIIVIQPLSNVVP